MNGNHLTYGLDDYLNDQFDNRKPEPKDCFFCLEEIEGEPEWIKLLGKRALLEKDLVPCCKICKQFQEACAKFKTDDPTDEQLNSIAI